MMEDNARRDSSTVGDIGPSAADARAPTPRMVNLPGGAPTSQIVAPTPQQALFNPYVLGATAAAAQYPAFAAAAAAGHSPLLLAAAAAVRNPASIGLANQLLLNPSAAALAAMQQFQNPYLLNSVAIPGLTPQLAAFYYNQQVQAVAAAHAGGLPSPVLGTSQSQQMTPGTASLAVSTSLTPGFAQSQSPVISSELRSGPYIAPSARRAELVASANNMNLARRQSAPILDVSGARMVGRRSPGDSVWKSSMERSGRLSTSSHSAVDSSGGGGPKPTLSSPEAIQEHISRLISENEAIVEPMPPILNKRRSYRHQNCLTPTQQTVGEYSKGSPNQSRAIRSHSLVEGSLLRQGQFPQSSSLLGSVPPPSQETKHPGDLHGTPITFPASPLTKPVVQNFECRFCSVGFSNEKSLDAHVFRCTHNPAGNGNISQASSLNELTSQITGALSNTSNEGESSASSEMSPKLQSVSPPPKISSRFNDQTKTTTMPQEWRNHPLKKRILAAAADDAATEATGPKIMKLEPTSPLRAPSKPPLTRATTHLVVFPEVSRKEVVSCRSSDSFSIHRPSPILADRIPANLEPKKLQEKPGLGSGGKFITGPAPTLTPAQYPVLFPQVSLSSMEKSRNFSPYCVTVQVPGAQSFEAPRSGRRPRHVTAPTFVCLKRPQPMSLPHTEPKLSMYSTWQQAPVNPMEAKLNVLWMSGCCTRPQRGSPFWKYTVATEQLSVPRMTHSSFWEISKKAQEQKQHSPDSSKAQEAITSISESKAQISGKKLSIATQTTNTISLSTVMSSEKNLREDDSAPKCQPDLEASEHNRESISAKIEATKANTGGVDAEKRLMKDKLRGAIFNPKMISSRKPMWERVFNGGIKTNEKYTYVRGRGKGRYKCEKCGMRCRKPSMLLKHIKSHQNLRPYNCASCSFSFKTKGNLTKHLKSKAHRNKTVLPGGTSSNRRNTEQTDTDYDSDDNRLEIDSTAGSGTESADEVEDHEQDMDESDAINNEEDEKLMLKHLQTQYYWLPERSVHTPPAQAPEQDWSDRNCDSLPPYLHLCSEEPMNSSVKEEAPPVVALKNAIGNEPSPSKVELVKRPEPGSSKGLTNHYLMPSKSSVKCEQCDKEFPDQGKLRVHTHVHNYEQSRSSRRNNYACPTCNVQIRTKAQLQKHIETRHGNVEKESINVGESGSVSSAAVGSDHSSPQKRLNHDNNNKSPASRIGGQGSVGINNPRPFYCQDCDKGFRIHGHLAKHLRSKQHITHLETLDKLPIGFYAALEASKGINLAEDLDTSDCDTCLAGLRDLSAKITPSDPAVVHVEVRDDSNECDKLKHIVGKTPSHPPVSLACTEQMLLSPSPPPVISSPTTGSSAQSLEYEGKAQTENSAETSAQSQKSVIADVWVPPKETDIAVQRSSKKVNECPETSQPERQPEDVGPKEEARSSTPPAVTGENPVSEETASADSNNDQIFLCPFCKQEFPSRPELDIHLHSDHIQMRDGKDYKCPRANCDKVFPSKESLRIHIAAHYNGVSVPVPNGGNGTFERDGDVSRETMAALQRKLGAVGGAQGPSTVSVPALTVGNQSPGTPEESQTSIAAINGGRKKMKTHLVSLNSIPEASGASASSNVSAEFKSPGSVGGNNSPNSETSEVASRASSSHSASPLPSLGPLVGGPATLGKPLNKRKSMENDCNGLSSPLGHSLTGKQISSPDGRRCISASENSPRASYPPHFFSPGGLRLQSLGSSSMSLPAVPAQLRINGNTDSQQAALAWMAQGFTPGFLPPQLMYQQHAFLNTSSAASDKSLIGPIFNTSHPQLNGNQPSSSNESVSKSTTHHVLNGVSSRSGEGSSVTPEAAVTCPVCNKNLPPSIPLQDHLMVHIQSQSRPHVCEHCDAGFTTPAGLNSHLLTHQQQPQTNRSES